MAEMDAAQLSPITEEVKAQMRVLAARYPVTRSAMLPCLHLVQEAQGRITLDGVLAVAEVLGVKSDEVESIVTFYSMYSTEPRGRYMVHVCTSISCYLRGCDALLHRFEERLGIAAGQTTSDGRFSLATAECLAACGGGPVVQVNGEFIEQVTPERAEMLLDRLARDESIVDLAARWKANDSGGFVAEPQGPAGSAGAGVPGTGTQSRGGVRLDVAPRAIAPDQKP